ncbi:MAG: hypothetical protein ACOYCD_00435 [Kiritimatiellia bacterium]|jgi:peptidoglycan hydrolase CwlO-like protein
MYKPAIIFSIVCAVAFLVSGRLTADDSAPSDTAPAAPSAFTPAPTDSDQPEAPVKSFSVEMSTEFMRKVMEISAKIESIKKQTAERRAELFETNAEIKGYKKQLVALQKKVNAILAADKELSDLEMERDIILTTMPSILTMQVRPGVPGGMFPASNLAPMPPEK